MKFRPGILGLDRLDGLNELFADKDTELRLLLGQFN